MIADWKPIKWDKDKKKFVGELPICDKSGAVPVILSYTYGNEQYVTSGVYFEEYKNIPAHFVCNFSSESINAWDYSPEPYKDINKKDSLISNNDLVMDLSDFDDDHDYNDDDDDADCFVD